MNFKEALIAHLQGEKVEASYKARSFVPFVHDFGEVTIENSMAESIGICHEFRLAPRTITVNGVEVPAPPSWVPELDDRYAIPDVGSSDLWISYVWTGHPVNHDHLSRGLVYLNKEDAIARAKAMLITS